METWNMSVWKTSLNYHPGFTLFAIHLLGQCYIRNICVCLRVQYLGKAPEKRTFRFASGANGTGVISGHALTSLYSRCHMSMMCNIVHAYMMIWSYMYTHPQSGVYVLVMYQHFCRCVTPKRYCKSQSLTQGLKWTNMTWSLFELYPRTWLVVDTGEISQLTVDITQLCLMFRRLEQAWSWGRNQHLKGMISNRP